MHALGERVGHLTHDELRSIEDALLLVPDLPRVDGNAAAKVDGEAGPTLET
jgi:hypothetical protein